MKRPDLRRPLEPAIAWLKLPGWGWARTTVAFTRQSSSPGFRPSRRSSVEEIFALPLADRGQLG